MQNVALYIREFKMTANAVENDCPTTIVRFLTFFKPLHPEIGLSIFFSVHFTFLMVLIKSYFL